MARWPIQHSSSSTYLSNEALQVGVAEKQGKDFLRKVDLPADDHRLPPLPPAADVRPRGVVKDLIRFREESGHVASVKRRNDGNTTEK